MKNNHLFKESVHIIEPTDHNHGEIGLPRGHHHSNSFSCCARVYMCVCVCVRAPSGKYRVVAGQQAH